MKKGPDIMAVQLGRSRLCIVFQGGLTYRDVCNQLVSDAVLFQIFADLEPTVEGIAEFRKKFSITDSEMTVFDRDFETTVMEIHTQSEVISCQNWKDEILAMRRGIDLWNLIRTNNASQLKQFIKWEPDPLGGISVVYDSQVDLDPRKSVPLPGVSTREIIASESINPGLMRQLRAGDTIGPAKIYIAELINDRLKDGVLPRMFARLIEESAVHVSPTHAIQLVPKNFVAAAWLQLAAAIDGDSRFSSCHECKRWFEVGFRHTRTHKDRKYCSEKCKVNNYRNRVEEARRLFASGVKIPKIASLLSSDSKTVKGWVGSKEKGG